MTRTFVMNALFVIVLCILTAQGSTFQGAGAVGSHWLEDRLRQYQAKAVTPVSEDETRYILGEAESSRMGLGNHTMDDARAWSLYWTAAAGTGPAAALAMHQLGWLHVLPASMAPPLPLSSFRGHGGTLESLEPDTLPWRRPLPPQKTLMDSALSLLSLRSLQSAWMGSEPQPHGDDEHSVRSPSDRMDRNVSVALALWQRSSELGNAESHYILATHLAAPAFLAANSGQLPSPLAPNTPASDSPPLDPLAPSPAVLKREQELSSTVLLHFAAKGGSVGAQMALGHRYYFGYGMVASCEAARPYYELAANQAALAIRGASGHYPGQLVVPPADASRVRLSDYDHGKDPLRLSKQHDRQVVQYFEAASLAGDAAAKTQLGNLYLNGGRGLPQDIRLAVKMYRGACDGGDPGAYGILGLLTYAGIGGVSRSVMSAAALFREGEQRGDANSLLGLGILHAIGAPDAVPPIPKDRSKAINFLERASKRGSTEALYQLGLLHIEVAQSVGSEESAAAAGSPDAGTGTNRRKRKKRRSADRDEGTGDGDSNASPPLEHNAAATPTKPGDTTKADTTARSKKRTSRSNAMQNALKCLSTAAQHGHILAIHKIATLHVHGDGVMKNCNAAVLAFKQVAERAPGPTGVVEVALDLWEKGDIEGSRLMYAHAAEMGFEIAQANAAWILERAQISASAPVRRLIADLLHPIIEPVSNLAAHVSPWDVALPSPSDQGLAPTPADALRDEVAVAMEVCGALKTRECEAQALRFWRQASKQRNPEASLKVGDYAFFGRGDFSMDGQRPLPEAQDETLDAVQRNWSVVPHFLASKYPAFSPMFGHGGDAVAAARNYKIAAELRQPQALWNLGWMYHWGIGVPFDPHLSKRYYDSAVEVHSDARWPARVGLFALRVTAMLWDIDDPFDPKQGDAAPSVDSSDGSRRAQSAATTPSVSKTRRRSAHGGPSGRGDGKPWLDMLTDELLGMDTLVAIGLTTLLFLVLQIRRHHQGVERMVRRQREQLVREQAADNAAG